MNLGQAIDHVRMWVDHLDLARQPECYSVSEAVYKLAGGKKAGLKVMRISLQNEKYSHWFLLGPHDELIDLTAGQFDGPQDYSSAKRASFYPRTSKLAERLMNHA